MSYLVRIRPEAERDVRDAASCICDKGTSYSDTRKSIRPLGRAPTILPKMS
jgi:plasmid stabilization system protein ParE